MFNLNKIENLYGKSVSEKIQNETELVLANIEVLYKLGFESFEEIFYAYAIAFLQDEQEFKNKVLSLCSKFGSNFLKILDENIDLWEEII